MEAGKHTLFIPEPLYLLQEVFFEERAFGLLKEVLGVRGRARLLFLIIALVVIVVWNRIREQIIISYSLNLNWRYVGREASDYYSMLAALFFDA